MRSDDEMKRRAKKLLPRHHFNTFEAEDDDDAHLHFTVVSSPLTSINGVDGLRYAINNSAAATLFSFIVLSDLSITVARFHYTDKARSSH